MGGGGDNGTYFFCRLKLRSNVKKLILNRLPSLKADYNAVHIRNTDYTTNYKSAFAAVEKQLRGKKVIICSDDANCVDYFSSHHGKNCDLLCCNIWYLDL